MDAARIIELPPLTTRAAFQPKSLNGAARTVELVFSTGAPVERYDYANGGRYVEKLSLNPAHVRIGRLNDGGPVLNAHKAERIADIIGAVVTGTVSIRPDAARATVKFSRRADVEPIWQDVKTGIIRSVSVGYRTYRYEETPARETRLMTRTAVDWEPYEISMVPIPADAGAKVRAGNSAGVNRCLVVRDGGGAFRCPICGGPGSLQGHARCFEPSQDNRLAFFGEPWV